MSYCRWSSDDFHCDVYAYEGADGFWIHVASSRYVGDIPKLPFILDVESDVFFAAYKEQHEFLETASREKIGLEYDGQSFVFPDLPSFLAGMLDIKSKGYVVPEFVLEAIRLEIKEQTKN